MRREEKLLRLHKDIAHTSIEACESAEAIAAAMTLLHQIDRALRRRHVRPERRADRD